MSTVVNVICTTEDQVNEIVCWLEDEGHTMMDISCYIDEWRGLGEGGRMSISFDPEDPVVDVDSYNASSMVRLVRALREHWPSERRLTWKDWNDNY